MRLAELPWVLDLDGVIRLGDRPVPGAAEAVARLRQAGADVVFATNNAYRRIGDQEASLEAMGIPAAGAVIGSAEAGARLLEPGERVLVVGGPGLHEAVAARGCDIVDDGPCDAVISGLDRELRYESIRRATLAIRAGARWVLTNPDRTFPTPHGLEPGAGAIGAAIAAASGAEPAIGGKPEGAMVELLRERLGPEGIVVGDRTDTDGRFATALGYRFALVLTGVTTPDDLPVDPEPWAVAPDLLALVERLEGPDG
jgi:HAD superfamily hydrolase (TIGR01450 family)